MKQLNQGLLRFPFAHDRWRKPPYSDMVLQHEQLGRAAIQVYEAAVSLITSQHCVAEYDDVFILCLSEDLHLPQEEIVDLLDIAMANGLFNKSLFEKTHCLTSKAIQMDYFNVRKNFRYSDTLIEAKHILIPFTERRLAYIGYVVEDVEVEGVVQPCFNEHMCRLYTKKKYQSLFSGEEEVRMQKAIQRQALGLFNR